MITITVRGISSNLCHDIQACVVPIICAPLSGQVIETAKEKYEHLRDVPLADTNVSCDALEIDMFVGANYIGILQRVELNVENKAQLLWR